MASERQQKQIDSAFTYHAPKSAQIESYERLRAGAKQLAVLILELSPESAEQTHALTNLQECVFWANAAVARNT